MQDQNNSEVLDISPVITPEAPAPKVPRMSLQKALRLISDSYSKGDISKAQVVELRRQLNVPTSFFTKKKTKADIKKNRKKLATASRRTNRGLGKGQKRNNGHTASSAR